MDVSLIIRFYMNFSNGEEHLQGIVLKEENNRDSCSVQFDDHEKQFINNYST